MTKTAIWCRHAGDNIIGIGAEIPWNIPSDSQKFWKMVEGRSNRKFADELKVVEAMKSAGYDESLLYERKLITLTQMEKDFGKKAVAETLGELIVKPQGKPTLAPAKDKRPEFKPEEQLLAEFDK